MSAEGGQNRGISLVFIGLLYNGKGNYTGGVTQSTSRAEERNGQ
jgi:hypothetical protein